MENQPTLRETKKHGAAWFPFNIYPCAIPQDFTQVALHWQDSMELVFVKKGRGIVQAGLTSYTAAAGDIYVFAPGVLHALRQLDNERMEYENIIFDLELLGDNADTRRLKTALQLVEEHYMEDISIDRAAAACGCSASHFMRWFKAMTAQSFTAFLNEHRLNAAAAALRAGDDTVLAIAESCGFENLSYFNRMFKRKFGLTPREYRGR